MGFDLAQMQRLVTAHGRVARVVIAEVRGSAPREVGAAMIVWDGGQEGTIGGGTLEFEAAKRALDAPGLSRHALGPDLGQCCGGSVALLTEHWDGEALAATSGPVLARPVSGASDMPLPVKRLLDRARAQGDLPAPQLLNGWFIEPLAAPSRSVWIWGAGHVGRAIVQVLAPMPDFALTWCDAGSERFPSDVPHTVTTVPAADLSRLAAHAPRVAHHLILTYSHEIDLALCDALLRRGFASAGLIGSATKWARFRKRLAEAGHTPEAIAAITCPIGDPGLGKHPQAIAVGVAAALLNAKHRDSRWQNTSSTYTA